MTAGIGQSKYCLPQLKDKDWYWPVEILYTSAFFNVKKAEVNNIRLANTSLHQVY